MPGNTQGPLLQEILDAEARATQIVCYPSILWSAQAIVDLAQKLSRPLLWPVSDEGQRLVGAAELLAQGKFETYTWGSCVNDRVVLLIAPIGVSNLSIATAADCAWRSGAREVHGCGLDIAIGAGQRLTTFTRLERPRASAQHGKKSA
jgi:hypothetical protein